MNRDDVIRICGYIRMAREVGLPHWYETEGVVNEALLIKFAALVASAEREACAGLRKEVVLQGKHTVEYEEGFWDGLEKYEDLIKARGLT